MAKEKVVPIGADGVPMTPWQIGLRRLCVVMIAWAALELLIALLLVVAPPFVPVMVLENIISLMDMNSVHAWMLLGVSTMIGALLNVVIAVLGIRGAENPQKITLFFWIALIDGVITTWALAGNISNGVFDPTSVPSGLFIISLAVCAWQVRKQTGYFDKHP